MRHFGRIAACHLAAGIVCAAAFNINVTSILSLVANSLFTALIGSQLCLLGMGVPFALKPSADRRKRVGVLVGSTLWLWLLTQAVLLPAKPVPPPLFILLLAPAVSLAAGAFGLAIWALGGRLERTCGETADDAGAFRFGIRHLLIFMAALSALLTLGRICRESGLHATYMSTELQVSVLFMLSVTTVGIAGIALWASLTRGAPLHRVPITVVAAAALGLLPGYYFDLPLAGYLILAAVAAVLSIISAATLLAIRGCGYRLVRVSSAQSWARGDAG